MQTKSFKFLQAILIIFLLYFNSSTAFGFHGVSYHVGQKTMVFFDSARNREIITEIWYPSSSNPVTEENPYLILPPTVRNGEVIKDKFPLIMLSHGTGGGRFTLQWLASGLAKEGYIVAAVDHWGNTYDNTVPEYFLKVWERPLDISFALTKMLENPDWRGLIDENRIGAAGFSLGGFTVITLVGAEFKFSNLIRFARSPGGKEEMMIPELPEMAEMIRDDNLISKLEVDFASVRLQKDSRIKAVMAISPAIGQSFKSSAHFRNINIPVMIIGAQNDKITPIPTNAIHYHKMIKNSKIHIFEGEAGHYVFLNNAQDSLKKNSPTHFSDPPSVNRAAIHEETIEMAKDFFKIL